MSFLRRSLEKVRRHDWSAVVVDLIVVVLGVFIGLQAANWNEERLEDQRALGFLKRLSSDLNQELASIDKRVAYVGRSIAYGEAALEWAENGTLADGSQWQTVLAFFQASRILPYSPVDSTYQEMRSAGELGLVRDANLRNALTDYFVSGTFARSDYILQLNPEYRSHVRGLTPYRIARYITTECFDLATVVHKPCGSPVDEASAGAMLVRYAKDPTLVTELAFWVDSAHQMITILGQVRATCVELKQRIDSQIGTQP